VSLKWDKRFIDMALHVGSWSKDPSTQVGAILVRDQHIIATGYNGFPKGIADTDDRLNDRPTKYGLVVHAELNSILAAAKFGIATGGSTLYVVARSVKTGKIWGGAPCLRCAVETIQSGVSSVVVPSPVDMEPSWVASCEAGKQVLHEAGVRYEEIDYRRGY